MLVSRGVLCSYVFPDVHVPYISTRSRKPELSIEKFRYLLSSECLRTVHDFSSSVDPLPVLTSFRRALVPAFLKCFRHFRHIKVES